ncbi:MAG TPA: prepilin-type N-terminal cleavage/methylation domain-containing protein [Candidatus Saccharimonadales bacterium]|jgi:prepilin-type N-terminal cleavage/methylation domain-containing protein|nr:prepilin-type N-terminal cleavage/methylation domain-containing protein [Candidatus Saccharimonadales bacterium]
MEIAIRHAESGKGRGSQGFSLIELLLAMVVIVVAILGGMIMVGFGMLRNNSNKVDTAGTNVAQSVLERIASTGANVNIVLPATDCLQTNPATSTLKINTAAGGAQTQANGDIDFTQSPTALNAANYQMTYIVCGTNGLQSVYDVRWNIVNVGAFGKLVTAAAQQTSIANGKGTVFLRPITLRTVVGL